MILLGLVETDTVRSLLGVEPAEMTDTVVTDFRLEEELEVDIESWLTSETINEILTGESAGTQGYSGKAKYLRLYARYRAAVLISPHVRLGVATQVSDGQDTFERSAGAVKELLKELRARANSYKESMLALYSSETDTAVLFASARPSYDPVTNETS